MTDITDIEDHRNKKCEHFELLFEFTNPAKDFAYGFEAGTLWNRMKEFFQHKHNYELRDVCFNKENYALVCRMCNTLEVRPDVKLDGGWYIGSIKRRIKA